jgi:hypothetical protein
MGFDSVLSIWPSSERSEKKTIWFFFGQNTFAFLITFSAPAPIRINELLEKAIFCDFGMSKMFLMVLYLCFALHQI